MEMLAIEFALAFVSFKEHCCLIATEGAFLVTNQKARRLEYFEPAATETSQQFFTRFRTGHHYLMDFSELNLQGEVNQ